MGISQKGLWIAALALAGLGLAGCATQAMKQAKVINTGATAANAQMQACAAAVIASPSMAAIGGHAPTNQAQPTLQQLADETYPDAEQITAIYAINQMLQDCRKPWLTAYSSFAPGIALVAMDAYQKADQETLLLVQKKISWGEYNKVMEGLTGDYAKAVAAEGQKINTQLAQENAAEMQQRQRAAEALAQFSLQEQAIAAANRPITTNCNSFGNNVNCVTH